MNDNLTPHKSLDYNKQVLRTIPYYSLFHIETIELIKAIKPDVKTWMDTGCGTGTLIEKAINEFPDCKFFLSDPSENMLSVCQKKFENNPVEIIGTFPTIELDPKFNPDVLTAIQSHHYMDPENRKKTTKHCYNLLKPNGLYITFENIRPDSKTGIVNGLNRWKTYQKNQGKSDMEVDNHIKRFDKEYFPIKIVDHIELMKESGFETVELFWMSYMQAGFYGIKNK